MRVLEKMLRASSYSLALVSCQNSFVQSLSTGPLQMPEASHKSLHFHDIPFEEPWDLGISSELPWKLTQRILGCI